MRHRNLRNFASTPPQSHRTKPPSKSCCSCNKKGLSEEKIIHHRDTEGNLFFPGRETTTRENHLPLRGNGYINQIPKFKDINKLTGEIIGAAIEVHKILGPGLLESVYEECLCHELNLREIPYERQKNSPINFNVPVLKDGIKRLPN
jgi:hypothetical protein